MHISMAALLLTVSLGGAPDDTKAMQGKWKVAAVFEDGQSLSEREIFIQLFADGLISVDGPMISFMTLGSTEPRKLAYTLDTKSEPKGIDLIGAKKGGGKGIYLVNGDSLMVCLAGVNETTRPRD